MFLGASRAEAALFLLNIEPIIGYERTELIKPTPHMKNRLVYGGRVTFGFLLLSAEGEYTRGQSEEAFPDQDLSTKQTDDKLKIGLRSELRISSLLSVIARGGVQAKKSITEETVGGNTTKTVYPITYKPYAGLGLSAGIASKLRINGGVTVVFNEFPNMDKNEYQTTLGFTVRLP